MIRYLRRTGIHCGPLWWSIVGSGLRFFDFQLQDVEGSSLRVEGLTPLHNLLMRVGPDNVVQ